MVAALFVIYLISMIFTFKKRRNISFTILVINLILCFFMLVNHTTVLLNR